MTVTYKNVAWEHDYKRGVELITFHALSSFKQGGLTYFKTDRFNYKVIETNSIVSIEE